MEIVRDWGIIELDVEDSKRFIDDEGYRQEIAALAADLADELDTIVEINLRIQA